MTVPINETDNLQETETVPIPSEDYPKIDDMSLLAETLIWPPHYRLLLKSKRATQLVADTLLIISGALLVVGLGLLVTIFGLFLVGLVTVIG